MDAVRIKCNFCVKSTSFWREPTELELFARGFNMWGRDKDNLIYATCFECTEDLSKEVGYNLRRKKSNNNHKDHIFVEHKKIEPHVNDVYFEVC